MIFRVIVDAGLAISLSYADDSVVVPIQEHQLVAANGIGVALAKPRAIACRPGLRGVGQIGIHFGCSHAALLSLLRSSAHSLAG
ncbi:hypothetical protein JOD97_001661 [Duganella sp. 1411]|nr:hypothetical protein [Duganella sp. 1411]